MNKSRIFRNVIVLSEKKCGNCAGEPCHRRRDFSGIDAAREPPVNHYCFYLSCLSSQHKTGYRRLLIIIRNISCTGSCRQKLHWIHTTQFFLTSRCHRPTYWAKLLICLLLRGRSQLSTFMKAYAAYARGEGVRDHRTLFFPENQHLILITDNVL